MEGIYFFVFQAVSLTARIITFDTATDRVILILSLHNWNAFFKPE